VPKSSSFDQHYFDHWYRDPSQRVSTLARTTRKAKLTLALAEYYLERPVRTVLDVGCGEGQWQPILKKISPRIQYTGIDPSLYAIEKFGKKRNLIYGKFSDLNQLSLSKSYDLIICSDLLYYIPEPTLKSGLQFLSKRLHGIAFLEAYSSTDALEGDTQGMLPRTAQDYHRIFEQSGFISCGSHCYVSASLAHRVTTLEGIDVNLNIKCRTNTSKKIKQ